MSEWDLGPVAEAGGEPARPADAAAADAAAAIADLRQQAAAAQDERLRALAEVASVRRRCGEHVSRAQAEATARVAARWLPVVDSLERALEFSAEDLAAMVEGIQAVRDQALGVLAALDFPRRDDTGTPFDPARHEAVAVRDRSGVPAGTIIDTTRPGYGEGARQLRPARVVVAGAGPARP